MHLSLGIYSCISLNDIADTLFFLVLVRTVTFTMAMAVDQVVIKTAEIC